jgi:hypothetical protein
MVAAWWPVVGGDSSAMLNPVVPCGTHVGPACSGRFRSRLASRRDAESRCGGDHPLVVGHYRPKIGSEEAGGRQGGWHPASGA